MSPIKPIDNGKGDVCRTKSFLRSVTGLLMGGAINLRQKVDASKRNFGDKLSKIAFAGA